MHFPTCILTAVLLPTLCLFAAKTPCTAHLEHTKIQFSCEMIFFGPALNFVEAFVWAFLLFIFGTGSNNTVRQRSFAQSFTNKSFFSQSNVYFSFKFWFNWWKFSLAAMQTLACKNGNQKKNVHNVSELVLVWFRWFIFSGINQKYISVIVTVFLESNKFSSLAMAKCSKS